MLKTTARWSAFTLIGKLVPPLAGLAILPYIFELLSANQFADFGILMTVLVMLTIFDFGITKSLVRLVAINSEEFKDKFGRFGSLFWCSSLLQIFIGLLLSASIIFCIEKDLFRYQSSLIDLDSSFQVSLLFGSIPFLLLAGTSRGFMEGRGDFSTVNITRCVFSIPTYISPILTFHYLGPSWIITIVLLIKSLEALTLFSYTLIRNQFVYIPDNPTRFLKPLLGFGIWVMVANFLTPMIVYLERFFILNFSTAEEFGTYYIAAELASRSLVLASAFATAMFTIQSRMIISDKLTEYEDQLSTIQGYLYSALSAFVIIDGLSFLKIWLGPDFDISIHKYWSILSVGAIFNALGLTVLNKSYASGNSKRVALMYLVQIPVYLVILIISFEIFSVSGLAIAVVIRQLLDLLMLWIISNMNTKGFRLINLMVSLCKFILFILISTAALQIINFAVDANLIRFVLAFLIISLTMFTFIYAEARRAAG